ncbi:MAG: polyprenyl synthetase family protein [Chloroflexi bacterium]|nr:polyprenyl synthetase family protein [Chloroflexota bacterium]MDL1882517.1 polyprenyl synthetase family protein [Anaerolineae bacterium CFX8]
MTLQEAMQAVEAKMYEVVNSDVGVLRDASRHILEAGGKRIRPRLLLLAYAANGGQKFDEAVPVAAAVELVHTASVVHDDINDHGVVRRGRPSVNAIWGRTFALLTGDYLFTKVYELMAPYRDLNVVLAEATVALVEGETLQASAVKENNFSRQVYYDIIARKTAALFRSAGRLGARLANAPDEVVEALGQYGFNIGLAFQIIDDVLDIIADSEKLGKTAGVDIAQGRGFAVAYAANGQPGGVAVVEETFDDPIVAIRSKVMRGGAIDEAYQQAEAFSQMAVESLRPLPDSPAKDALIEMAYTMVKRER